MGLPCPTCSGGTLFRNDVGDLECLACHAVPYHGGVEPEGAPPQSVEFQSMTALRLAASVRVTDAPTSDLGCVECGRVPFQEDLRLRRPGSSMMKFNCPCGNEILYSREEVPCLPKMGRPVIDADATPGEQASVDHPGPMPDEGAGLHGVEVGLDNPIDFEERGCTAAGRCEPPTIRDATPSEKAAGIESVALGIKVERANRAATPEPPPIHRPGQGDIQGLVIDDLKARREEGIRRYGTPLQAHNGRDAMNDLYQEILDAACYLKQVIEERGPCRAEPPKIPHLADVRDWSVKP